MVGRLVVCTAFVIIACGGDPDGVAGDAGLLDDAPGGPDARQCGPVVPPSCEATAAPTAPSSSTVCNPLTQAGCAAGQKCTWIADQAGPQGAGHMGCAPAGSVAVGCPCTQGAPGTTGYDDCAAGAYCSNNRCRAICDQQGGTPMCGAGYVCSTYENAFNTGSTTPRAAGVCTLGCDPLADNDFLGSGFREGCACGSGQGCYGYPSYGTPPATAFSCATDRSNGAALVHRTQCTESNNCADPGPTVYINSCSQGYLPLLYEQSGSTTIICVALCKPLNCWAGNCGTNNENRLGAAPHRCSTPDRRGTFNTSESGEHCQFMWWREIDDGGQFLPSAHSDTLGVCFDMSKYRYDSTGDNKLDNTDMALPACAQLQDGAGAGSDRTNPLTYFGAVDLGCVDSSHGPAMATPRNPLDIRGLYRPTSAGPPIRE